LPYCPRWPETLEIIQIMVRPVLKESVANVSQIIALDRSLLTERTGKLPRPQFDLVLSGIDVVLGR